MFTRVVILSLWVTLGGCAASSPPGGTGPGVHHVVLCWLKEPGNAMDRQRLIEVSRSLRSIPGVRELRLGPPLESNRDIVDDSFDVGLYLRFDSVDALQAYLGHPQHVRAVREVIGPLTRQLRVHDFTTPQ